ncbi:hypothetical protein [Acinetobacter sp.]|uniref:hypothetical protein n=1 Tax=Acinetobacter sp. TaxID=472 RepID=UPI0035AE1A6A
MAALSLIKPRLFYGFLFKLHAVYAADFLMPDRPERPERNAFKTPAGIQEKLSFQL